MNSAVYGKTMENVRNRVDVTLTKNKKDSLKWTSKPNHITQKIFGNDLVAIHKVKTTLTLNKPVYLGIYILELSKILSKTNMTTNQDYYSQILPINV